MKIREFILNKSKEIGIDIVRIGDGEASDFLEETLLKRIEEDKITEFEDREIGAKLNIDSFFKDYKSVIVVGQSYYTDYKRKADFNKGLISKSSWGEDYHHVLKRKMDSLIELLREEYGGNYEAHVDTGPLVDRNLAYNSGIGYYGKNCSIINRDYGSFIFIGYIITDLFIDRDERLESECGQCRRCIDYCPTKALEGPYSLNPKKCISYLTQTKEKIPYELREKMGAKVYGCDTCQDVCPKNKNIKLSNSKEFIPEKTKGYIDLDEILDMTNREFKDKYGDMAGAWRGKNVLKRNAIIAIANKKDSSYLDKLGELLYDDSYMIVEYSLWSILKLDKFKGRLIIEENIDRIRHRDKAYEEYRSLKKYFLIEED